MQYIIVRGFCLHLIMRLMLILNFLHLIFDIRHRFPLFLHCFCVGRDVTRYLIYDEDKASTAHYRD